MNLILLFLRAAEITNVITFAAGLSDLLILLACAVGIGIVVAVAIAITRGWV